jgi:hypothetical protein
VHHGAGADGGQQFLRILGEQDERGVRWRLFQKLEEVKMVKVRFASTGGR